MKIAANENSPCCRMKFYSRHGGIFIVVLASCRSFKALELENNNSLVVFPPVHSCLVEGTFKEEKIKTLPWLNPSTRICTVKTQRNSSQSVTV